MERVGALWSQTGKKGTPYITGILDGAKLPDGEKIPIIVFKNNQKNAAKSPDYIVFLREERKPETGDMFAESDNDGFGSNEVPF